ncbi:hypothetical protein BHE74_00019758 [Ensete ventricosum]|nr:hypothetical protein BHE74_00019758 [Ensete ventricosum]
MVPMACCFCGTLGKSEISNKDPAETKQGYTQHNPLQQSMSSKIFPDNALDLRSTPSYLLGGAKADPSKLTMMDTSLLQPKLPFNGIAAATAAAATGAHRKVCMVQQTCKSTNLPPYEQPRKTAVSLPPSLVDLFFLTLGGLGVGEKRAAEASATMAVGGGDAKPLDLFLSIGLDRRTAVSALVNQRVTSNLNAVIKEVNVSPSPSASLTAHRRSSILDAVILLSGSLRD